MKHAPLVHIVDDDEAIRDSLSLLLQAEGMMVRTYASAGEFLDAFTPSEPACILLDVRMPDVNGMALLQELTARQKLLPVIMMTAYGDVPMAVQAIQSGAADFIEKPFDSYLLITRIRDCLRQQHVSCEYASRIEADAGRLDLLTSRERQVMVLLAQGDMNKQIATRLDISPRTVEVHRARIKEKLGVKKVAEIVRILLMQEQ